MSKIKDSAKPENSGRSLPPPNDQNPAPQIPDSAVTSAARPSDPQKESSSFVRADTKFLRGFLAQLAPGPITDPSPIEMLLVHE
jgi:hypothetical protein